MPLAGPFPHPPGVCKRMNRLSDKSGGRACHRLDHGLGAPDRYCNRTTTSATAISGGDDKRWQFR